MSDLITKTEFLVHLSLLKLKKFEAMYKAASYVSPGPGQGECEQCEGTGPPVAKGPMF